MLGGVQRQLGTTLLSPFLQQKLGTFVCKENAADLAALTELIDSGQMGPQVDRILRPGVRPRGSCCSTAR